MSGLDTALDIAQIVTPTRTPPTQRMLLYPKGDGYFYTKGPLGIENKIARDADVVHLANAETITGVKTFNSPFVQTQVAATPTAPPSGKNTGIYFKTDGLPYYEDSSGVEYPVNVGVQVVTVPVGSILAWSAAVAPTGYLICDGSAVSRSTYSQLFGVIGTTYGAGDGSTTFNLPDLKGRVPVGVGTATGAAGATAHTLAQISGEETHVLSSAEMPSHGHSLDNHTHNMDHTHLLRWDTNTNTTVGGGGNRVQTMNAGGNTGWLADGSNGLSPHDTGWGTGAAAQATGGSGAHNNMPPFLGLNYIIRYLSSPAGSGGGGSTGLVLASPALTAGVWTTVTHGLGLVARDVTFEEAVSGTRRDVDWRVKGGNSTADIEVRPGVDRAASYYSVYVEA